MSDEIGFDSQDEELLAIFLEETREQLDILDQGLVRLEREQDNTELIQGIFRAAHTLKGSSGAMGLRQMADLTHAMEDVLDRVRSKTLVVTQEIADALLRGLDALRSMLEAVENGQGNVVATGEPLPLAAELRALATGTTTAVASATPAIPLSALPGNQLGMLVNFAADCQMPAIRAFMVLRALDNLGTLIKVEPSQEDIDQDKVGQRLLAVLESTKDEESIRSALMSVPEVEWVRVARGDAAAGLRLDLPAREEGRTESSQGGTSAAGRQNNGNGHIATQQTVRVGVETLDRIMNLVGELVLDRTRITGLKDDLGQIHPDDEEYLHEMDTLSQHLGTIVEELHEQVLQARMLPVSQLFNRFPRLVRDLCRSLGKDVDFLVEGENEQLDRSVIEKLVDPLTHILRNSVDHGMETPAERERQGKPARGTVHLSACREEGHVLIQVADDGPGINADRLIEKALANGIITADRAKSMTTQEVFGLIFSSGLSTAKVVSDVSGRGVGMDVVKRNVEAIGGTIVVDSTQGLGTAISLKIPLTLAIVRALIVRVGGVAMAIPLSLVEETLKVPRTQLRSVRGRALLQWRDIVVPVVHLIDALPVDGKVSETKNLQLIMVRYGHNVVCFTVDGILGHQEIVVKSLGNYLGELPGLAGATILGNGKVALIVDVGKLFESGLLQQAAHAGGRFDEIDVQDVMVPVGL
ncbi:MAG TPA: chemotaxis protein CheA [Armatimonadota bacterium]|nr:chemotaxis protein CheA [Armatimonadota bacterium]